MDRASLRAATSPAVIPQRASRGIGLAVAGLCLAICASDASAQLIMGTGLGRSSRERQVSSVVDVSTVRQTSQYPQPARIADSVQLLSPDPIFGDYVAWGMAANDPGRVLYFWEPLIPQPGINSGLMRASYDNRDADGRLIVEPLGPVSLRNPDNTRSEFTVTAMAFRAEPAQPNGGKLYMWRNVNAGTPNIPGKGFYEIDPVSLDITPVFQVSFDQQSNYDIDAFDWDDVTDSFYVINDSTSNPEGRGLYRVDLQAQTFTKLAASPSEFRLEYMQGLACGGGKVYWVTGQAGYVYVYNLITGQFEQPFLSPFTNRGGSIHSATWAPGLLALFNNSTPTPTPPVTPTPIATPTATATSTPSLVTPTPTTAAFTPAPLPTATPRPTLEPTASPTPVAPSPTGTPLASATPSPTSNPSPTATPTTPPVIDEPGNACGLCGSSAQCLLLLLPLLLIVGGKRSTKRPKELVLVPQESQR